MSNNGIAFRKEPRNCVLQEIDEPPDFTDDPAFLRYKERVIGILAKSGERGLWLAELNSKLGKRRNDEWTNMALEDGDIEEFGGCRWRYRMRQRFASLPSDQDDFNFNGPLFPERQPLPVRV